MEIFRLVELFQKERGAGVFLLEVDIIVDTLIPLLKLSSSICCLLPTMEFTF